MANQQHQTSGQDRQTEQKQNPFSDDPKQQPGFMPSSLNAEENPQQAEEIAEEEQKRKEALTERD